MVQPMQVPIHLVQTDGDVKMKKTIYTIFVLMLLCLASASALTDYVGSPVMPYLIYGKVTYDGVGIGGAELTIKNENTLFSKQIVTTNDGYWQEDSSSWKTSSGYRPPIQGDDTITLTYGSQVKSFKVFEDKNFGGFRVNFESLVEPEPTPTPTPEPVEPTGVTKVTSNEDGTVALVEAYFGDTIEVVVQDNKLISLIDEEIDFDGDDYNVHEEIIVNGKLVTSLDDIDYVLTPYLVIPEGGIEYRYVFDDAIPKTEVEEDETLEITFLGEDWEITDITNNKLTLIYGDEKDINVGDTFKGVKLLLVTDDYVKVSYEGYTVKIFEDEIEDIGDIEVMATYLGNDDDNLDSTTLRVAEDVEVTIRDGDDYEDGDEWEWVITEDYIGITNQNEYEDIEEDYLPLREGDSITLPNDYVTIKFNSITTPDVTKLDIRVKDSYLHIRGDREDSFADEYDEIFIDANGIYDEDKVHISTDKVRIGESDIYIKLDGTTVKIGDLEIKLDMSNILYNGESYADKDDNYLDYQGIVFKDVENAVDDKDNFDVIVPDERPEAKITIKYTYEAPESIEPVPIEPEPIPIEIVEPIPPIVEPEPTPEPTPDEPDDEAEQTVWDSLRGLLIKILAVFGFGAGFLGLLRYWWKKDKKRAIKMAQTAIGRALSGQYDKYKK